MGKHTEFSLSLLALMSLFFPVSFGQLASSEAQSLFRIRRQLENPPVLTSWNRYTGFCSLPPSPSLRIVCSGNKITELTVVGNKGSPSLPWKSSKQTFVVSPQSLSSSFSIDSLFTTLSKLSNLEVLSLVSLGLWGSLPVKISRFSSLRVLNVSSNFIQGQIPLDISSMSNLQSLILSNNLFKGAVPDLKSLSGLEELDLSNNLLGPKFPSLGNKLVSVILRNNSFRSNLPFQLKNLDQLQNLDFSFNQLVGPIPSPLFSLPAIKFLNLAANELSGALPTNITCGKGLALVDLSQNLLIGKLPLCIRSNSSNRIVLYSWNCFSTITSADQHSHSFCDKEALAAIMPPIKKNTSKSKLGLLLGICGGIVGGVAALGILILVVYRKVRTKTAENGLIQKVVTEKSPVRISPRLLADARHMSQGIRLGALELPPYHVFTVDELEEVTNNFDPSNLVEGSKGQLYKGWLRDGSMVLVRCLKLKQNYTPQILTQQIEIVSKLRHRHLVSILGHCINTKAIYLVSEHISNRTLKSHLTEQKQEMLKWPQRVSAVIGVTRGMQFLHTGMVPGIFKNDLSTESIFLDENLIPKISGYNLPLPLNDQVGTESPINGREPGNLGSVEHGEKEDIYQLGVILLQVITGKPIASQSELDALKIKLERSLGDGPKKLQGVMDPTIRGAFAYESVRTAAEIAINCLCNDVSKRPTLEDVLWNLQYCVQVQDGWTSSENLSTQSQRFV